MAMISYNGDDDISTAAAFVQRESALYRHYRIDEARDCIEQFTGVSLSEDQTVELVQNARQQAGLGPIAEYNLPGGYEDEAEVNRPAPSVKPWGGRKRG